MRPKLYKNAKRIVFLVSEDENLDLINFCNSHQITKTELLHKAVREYMRKQRAKDARIEQRENDLGNI